MKSKALFQIVVGMGLGLASSPVPARFPVQHPVFPRRPAKADQVARLETHTRQVMAMSRDTIDTWIVPRSTFTMVACPNCEWPGGRRDRKNYWRWSPDKPEQIKCTHCGMVYPNPRYPMSAVEVVRDPAGQEQRFRYYPGADGYKYYIEGKIENARKQYMEQTVPRLTDLYVATGEERYARQALHILDRLALVYPHYNPQISRRPGSPLLLQDIPPLELDENGLAPVPPLGKGRAGRNDGSHYPYWSNRRGDGWNNWFYSEMPVGLALAWDQLATSPEIDRLSRELGRDVAAAIRNYLRDTANYCRSYPIYLGNMDPSLIRGFAVIGRVIGEPVLVYDALRRTRLILEKRFFPDGNWREAAPSYHSQTTQGLRNAIRDTLTGYSDPPGYRDPNTGERLVDLKPAQDLPFLTETYRALLAIRLPNGSFACVHDTWSPTTRRKALGKVGNGPMPSHLHWGMGHAILGTGRKDTGLQAHLHLSGGYGHTHADTLSLILFGRGRELVSDIGYTHTILRPFAVGSVAHNLVVVNETDQRSSGDNPPADGSLLAAGRLGALVQFVEASGRGAYPKTTSLYRRALSVVATPDGGAYTLDVFRVRGGTRHDWLLHGSADEDMTFAAAPRLNPVKGTLLPEGVTYHRWKGPYESRTVKGVNNAYGLFRNIGRTTGQTAWTLRMACTDGTALQTSVGGQPDAEVFCTELPSIRRAQEDSSRVYDYWMPAVVVRRSGENLESVFAAVHQPLALGKEASRVEHLAVRSEDSLARAVAVHGNGFTDYHLTATDATVEMVLEKPAIVAVGRYAFVRLVNNAPVAMGLLDGTHLEALGQSVVVSLGAVGQVTAIRNAEAGDAENALVVDAELSPRPGRESERVVVHLANGMTYGLAVRDIRRGNGKTVIGLEHRPGLRLTEDGQVAMTHWPLKEMAGPLTFHLAGHAWNQTE